MFITLRRYLLPSVRTEKPELMKAVWAGLLLLLSVSDLVGAQSSSPIEGTWELMEWLADGEAFVAPQIGGRFSLHDGVVLFQAFRKTEDGEVSTQGFGSYRFDGDKFSYGYDRSVRIVLRSESAPEVSVSKPSSPSEFTVVPKADGVHLTSKDGKRSFVVVGDSMQYLHDGKPLRKYRRARSE